MRSRGQDMKAPFSPPLVLRDVARCPHPYKIVFRDKAEAKRALKRTRQIRRKKFHAYRCDCGAWHLGHSVRPAEVLQ